MIKHKQNSGFTLLEMAVALAVLSLMAAYMTPNFLEQINEDRAEATIQETQAILDAARVYRLDTGTWPGGATCSTAWTVLTTGANPYLAGVTANNKYNSPYILSCTSNNFRVQQNLTANWDSYVANKLPSTTITNSATYTIASSVGIPGTEPALSSKLSRIATGNPEDVTMRTDLLMGGNDITGVGGIDAGSVNVTGATNTGSLAVTGNATVGGTTQTGTLRVTGNALISGNAGVTGTTTLNGALTVNTTSRFNGAADFREIVKLNKVVAEGSACSDVGALARTSTGLTLSCQSGVWANMLPNYAPTTPFSCKAPDYDGCQLMSDGFGHNYWYRIDIINKRFCSFNGDISYGEAGRCRLLNTAANTWTIYTGSATPGSDGQICYVSCW